MDFLCCGLEKRDEQAHGPVYLRQRGKSVQQSGSFRKAGPLQHRGVPGNTSSGGHEGSTETSFSSSWTPTLDSFQRSMFLCMRIAVKHCDRCAIVQQIVMLRLRGLGKLSNDTVS